uniref:Uncharacterized protein n=1 Tax=Rhizophora mucronata TaxID=61149 RepID=A0A2P2QTL9_RHIMU
MRRPLTYSSHRNKPLYAKQKTIYIRSFPHHTMWELRALRPPFFFNFVKTNLISTSHKQSCSLIKTLIATDI